MNVDQWFSVIAVLPFMHLWGLVFTFNTDLLSSLGLDQKLKALGNFDQPSERNFLGKLIGCRYCCGFWGGLVWVTLNLVLFNWSLQLALSCLFISYFLYYLFLIFVDPDLEE